MGLTFVCVETGDYKGRGTDYVSNLAGMIRRNVTVPYKFLCLTDDPTRHIGIETKGVEGCRGWWGKLVLYKRGTFPDGERVVFFDLDTLILANIDDVADYDGPLACLGNWRNGGWPISSAALAFEAGKECDIWDKWEEARRPCSKFGDDEWLRGMRPIGWRSFQRSFPGCYSYKFHKCQNGPPPGARIIGFCQRPKPHELVNTWVGEVWKP